TSAAGAIALEECSHDADQGMPAGGLVDWRKGTAHRPAAFFSSHTHDSAESLQDDVVAKIVFKRTRAAEAGNAAIDKVVALALEAFKVDAESFSYAGAIAFDNDICGPRELSSDLFAGFRLEVDCQAALVA